MTRVPAVTGWLPAVSVLAAIAVLRDTVPASALAGWAAISVYVGALTWAWLRFSVAATPVVAVRTGARVGLLAMAVGLVLLGVAAALGATGPA